MYEARRVKLCFPEPPTPISIAEPLSERRILDILARCATASLKNTSYIFDDEFEGDFPAMLSCKS